MVKYNLCAVFLLLTFSVLTMCEDYDYYLNLMTSKGAETISLFLRKSHTAILTEAPHAFGVSWCDPDYRGRVTLMLTSISGSTSNTFSKGISSTGNCKYKINCRVPKPSHVFCVMDIDIRDKYAPTLIPTEVTTLSTTTSGLHEKEPFFTPPPSPLHSTSSFNDDDPSVWISAVASGIAIAVFGLLIGMTVYYRRRVKSLESNLIPDNIKIRSPMQLPPEIVYDAVYSHLSKYKRMQDLRN